MRLAVKSSIVAATSALVLVAMIGLVFWGDWKQSLAYGTFDRASAIKSHVSSFASLAMEALQRPSPRIKQQWSQESQHVHESLIGAIADGNPDAIELDRITRELSKAFQEIVFNAEKVNPQLRRIQVGRLIARLQQMSELADRMVESSRTGQVEAEKVLGVSIWTAVVLLLVGVPLLWVGFRRSTLMPLETLTQEVAEATLDRPLQASSWQRADEFGILGREFAKLQNRLISAHNDVADKASRLEISNRDAKALAARLRQAKEIAEATAYTDSLTGLPNRHALGEFAEKLLGGRSVPGNTAYLLHVDLDRFKQVNDTLGHAAGDAILKRVSADLRNVIGPGDLVARIGGDEFILILTAQPNLEAAKQISRQLIAQISTPIVIDGNTAQVGASIGITAIPEGCTKSVDTLLLEADLALYDVKNKGRGAVKAFTSELESREAMTQRLIRDIEPAIADGQLVPHFQVQVDFRTGRVCGAEVLGRWEHPELGTIFPGQFLYVAERARLVEKIDQSVHKNALEHFARWRSEDIAPPHLSLNITARHLTSSGFIERFCKQLEDLGLEPSHVVFELVETILLDGEVEDVLIAARQLHDAGFTLAIDDFGTGRASLKSLMSIPAEVIKIDRSFIAGIHNKPKAAMLTEAIINIAQRLKLQVLAEGVEERAECETLHEMGCSLFQGHYFARAQSAAEFSEVLRDAKWDQVAHLEREDLSGGTQATARSERKAISN